MQRGSGVFDRSILGIKKLNDLGYGRPGTGLKLDLVYNPVGGFLAPEQVKTNMYACYTTILHTLDVRARNGASDSPRIHFELRLATRWTRVFDYDCGT